MDTGMKFGKDKCAYIKTEKRKNASATPIEMNGSKIKLIQEGESYRYLFRSRGKRCMQWKERKDFKRIYFPSKENMVT